MRRASLTNRLFALALLTGAGGACSEEPSDTTGQNQEQQEYVQQIQAELDAAAVSNPGSVNAFMPVKPVLKCVAKTGTNAYAAHFGYNNSSSSSVSIPVGFFNRFWPPPISKGQPTTFAPGTQADVVSVPFSGFSASIWVLGNHFAVATKFSRACPAGGTGGVTGTGGMGTGGRGTGGMGSGGTITGTGGMGAGGMGTGGICIGGALPSNCDDQNPCTIDSILGDPTTCNWICMHVAGIDGGACSDGNACTTGDTCQAGVCVGGTPKTCTNLDQCHIPGVCDPATGACSNPNAPDGRICNDNNACTVGDICVSGICTLGAPILCNAPDPCHAAGVCDHTTGACSNPIVMDGTACENDDPCNPDPRCVIGVCTSITPVVCAPIDQCHVAGVCDPRSGTCSNPVAPNGLTCSDGNACTSGDVCTNGACTPGTAKTCVASNVCHSAGICDPASGSCSNPAVSDGTACTDNNGCTLGDSCQAGVCTPGMPVICPLVSGQCQTGTCTPATGLCGGTNLPDGTPCDDGDVCTLGDACLAGVCTPREVPAPTECGLACSQCSFGVPPGQRDVCSSTADGCFNCIVETDGCEVFGTTPDRALCENLYACLVAPTHPGTSLPGSCTIGGDPSRCWCGTNLTGCVTDNAPPTQANGPCLQQIFAAGKSTDAATINLRFIDAAFPLGRAVNLAACRSNFCSSECSVHP